MNSKLIAIPVLTLTAVLAGCVHHRHHTQTRTVVARPVPAPVIVEPAPVIHTTTYVVEPPHHHHHSDPHRRPRVAPKHKAPPKPVVVHKPAPKPAPKPVVVHKPAPKPAPKPVVVHKSAPKPAPKPAPRRK